METSITPDNIEAFRRIFSCIDNTTLEGADTHEKIHTLCHSSLQMQSKEKKIPHVVAVCMYPTFVREAKEHLKGSGINVASVAGAFPAGQSPIAVKLQEVKYALDEGADEIDMVISRGALLEGNQNQVFDEISAIRQLCSSAHLKVILETGELQTPENIMLASNIAISAGADFIKTSTGKISISATPQAAEIMLNAIKNHYQKTGKLVGFKAAGGISTPEQALDYYNIAKNIMGEQYVANHTFRIGASRLTTRLFQFLMEKI